MRFPAGRQARFRPGKQRAGRHRKRDRFKRKDLVDEFGQLRSRLNMQVQLQRAARELIKVLHLVAARLGLARMIRDAGRKPADDEGNENEDDESDGIHRIGCDPGLGLVRRGIRLRPNGRKRDDEGLPKSAEKRRRDHDK